MCQYRKLGLPVLLIYWQTPYIFFGCQYNMNYYFVCQYRIFFVLGHAGQISDGTGSCQYINYFWVMPVQYDTVVQYTLCTGMRIGIFMMKDWVKARVPLACAATTIVTSTALIRMCMLCLGKRHQEYRRVFFFVGPGQNQQFFFKVNRQKSINQICWLLVDFIFIS